MVTGGLLCAKQKRYIEKRIHVSGAKGQWCTLKLISMLDVSGGEHQQLRAPLDEDFELRWGWGKRTRNLGQMEKWGDLWRGRCSEGWGWGGCG